MEPKQAALEAIEKIGNEPSSSTQSQLDQVERMRALANAGLHNVEQLERLLDQEKARR